MSDKPISVEPQKDYDAEAKALSYSEGWRQAVEALAFVKELRNARAQQADDALDRLQAELSYCNSWDLPKCVVRAEDLSWALDTIRLSLTPEKGMR
jgi:hypothetical protein